MIHLTINGQPVSVAEGTSVLNAARQLKIEIPTLCHHPNLTPFGGCRLCVVEVKGSRNPQASCTLPAAEGMEIQTESPVLTRQRQSILQMLLWDYHDGGYASTKDNELEHWAERYGVSVAETMSPTPKFAVDSDPNPFLWVDLNKCIRCSRCVRACAEVQGRFVWGMVQRGAHTLPQAGAESDLLGARCESCGACVTYCPTGALDNKLSMQAGKAEKRVLTTCTYCGVGCQFELNVKNDQVIRVTSTEAAPVNGNHLCVKGRYGYDFVHHPDRLTRPQVRRYLLEGGQKSRQGKAWEWVETDWETALSLASRGLHGLRETWGADALGVLSSAKCTNEENYLMNKFVRQVLGTNNIDHCARLCHASTVAGLAMSFGSGAMSNSMDDVTEKAALFFIIGSNTTEQHPVFGTKIRQAVLKRGAKLIVADPRRIDITEFASLHLRQKSGTDIALINGLMYLILENGWEDRAFIESRCENFDEFRQSVLQYPPEKVSALTGIPEAHLREAAQMMAKNRPMAVIWAMGITQHFVGVRNVMDLANLQMLLGNMGKPGGGVNPLRGQNNVQGACDMGALPNVYPGYQSVTSEESRAKFESAWGAASPTRVGLTVTEMMPGLAEGKVRGLYILGENPIMTDPDTNHIRHCLEQAELIVLQEIFPSETSQYADILLPGVSFAEKTGTFTNTERRVQMVRQAISPRGEARNDWEITADLARRILALGGRSLQPNALYAAWKYADSAAILDEARALTPSYAGITHARLNAGERLQWPVPNETHPGTPILHTQQFTRGKGHFVAIEHLPAPELPDEEYPFLLNTGRVIYHWHGGEMTRRAQGLMEVYGHPLIELNPQDAENLGVNGNRTLRISSRRGSIEAEAWVTDRVPPGMVYANFHFPEASANELTLPVLDPIAKIPEYKVCAVKVELLRKQENPLSAPKT